MVPAFFPLYELYRSAAKALMSSGSHKRKYFVTFFVYLLRNTQVGKWFFMAITTYQRNRLVGMLVEILKLR